MNNLKSYTEYAVSTPTTDFVIGFDFNYGTDAVNVTVDDVPATEAGYSVIYLNSTTMRLSPAVPTGVVRLQRETDIDVPDNQFTAGAKFIASNMDENFTQLRHAQQEVRDGFEKLSDDTYEIIDTLQVVGEAAQDAADAAEQAAQTANDAAAQVNDKVSYQDLDDAVELAVAPVKDYIALPFQAGKSYALYERVQLESGDIVKNTVAGNTVDPNLDMTGWVFNSNKNEPILLLAQGEGKDSTQIEAAISLSKTTGRKIVGSGDFKLTQTHNFREVCVDFENSTIEVVNPTDMLRVGWNAATTATKPQKFGRVFRRGGSNSTPTVRYEGSKDHFFYMQNCDFMELYADSTNAASDGSIAYCTFHLGYVRILHFWTNPNNTAEGAGNGGQIQWINENTFYIQRFSFFKSDGTYEHNHNMFYGGAFENSAAKLEMIKGWDNYFYSLRLEGSPTITFGPTTERNVIINTWDSSFANPVNTANVVDQGFNNIVIDDFSLYNSKQVVAYTDISALRLNTAVSNQSESNLQRIIGNSGGSTLLETGFIETNKDDWFRFVTTDTAGSQAGANSRYRPKISFYNSKMQPVPANANFIKDTGGTFSVVTTNIIQAGTNVAGGMLCITKEAIAAGVRFVKLAWSSNSPLTSSISNAVSLSIFKFSPKSNLFVGGSNQNPAQQIIVTAKPTQGFAPAGTGVVTQDGVTRFTNVFDFETTLTALSGTSLTVASAAGVQVGDVIGVNKNDLSTFWSSVAAISGNVITLADALSGASVGARVVFNRWL